jgi:hypothetical protein
MNNSGSTYNFYKELGAYSNSKEFFIVSGLILPWIKIYRQKIALRRPWFTIPFYLKEFLKGMFVLILILAPFSICIWAVQTYAPTWLKDEIKELFNIFFQYLAGLLFFNIIIENVYDLIRDYLFLRKVKLHDRMKREEICNILWGFSTAMYQTKFIHMVEEYKVKAVGEWPENFSLTSSGHAVDTQLAKLEEKWLGLDR